LPALLEHRAAITVGYRRGLKGFYPSSAGGSGVMFRRKYSLLSPSQTRCCSSSSLLFPSLPVLIL